MNSFLDMHVISQYGIQADANFFFLYTMTVFICLLRCLMENHDILNIFLY